MSSKDKMEFREWCVKERKEAQKSVESYESGRTTFHIRRDSDPLEDVTAERLADAKRIVADMDDFIADMDADDDHRT